MLHALDTRATHFFSVTEMDKVLTLKTRGRVTFTLRKSSRKLDETLVRFMLFRTQCFSLYPGHAPRALKSYQIAKENLSKNTYIQTSLSTHSKSIIEHDPICYLILLLVNDRMGNTKMTKSRVKDEYVRQAHASHT